MFNLFFIFLLSSPAYAGWSTSVNWYNRALYRKAVDSFLNPQNQVADIPKWSMESDLRPSTTWEKGKYLFKLNPRVIMATPEPASRDESRGFNENEVFLNEAYYQMTADTYQLTAGLQNYQWGPAELYSPSNPIFRFLLDQRSLFFQQRGRNLLRWNWTISNDWTLVSMMEVTKNSDRLPKEDQLFVPNGLIKLERALAKPGDYIGAVAGITPYQEPFVGEYGAYGFSEQLSVYLDARHQSRTTSYYANPDNLMLDRMSENFGDKDLTTMGTLGMRYEGSIDTRLEYVYHGAGLSEDQWKDVKRTLTTPGPQLAENFQRFYFPGRDFNKQHYAYLSARIPDIGFREEYTFFLRHLSCLQDGSSYSQVQADRLTGKSLNIYLEISYYSGSIDADLSSLLTYEGSLGFRWSLL